MRSSQLKILNFVFERRIIAGVEEQAVILHRGALSADRDVRARFGFGGVASVECRTLFDSLATAAASFVAAGGNGLPTCTRPHQRRSSLQPEVDGNGHHDRHRSAVQ